MSDSGRAIGDCKHGKTPSACVECLRDEVARLRDAIATHRSQKADDRCVEDDDRLYEALGDGWPTYAELEAEIKRLRSLIEYDRTGLAYALARMRRVIDGYSWLARDEWGSYEEGERMEATLRVEIGDCLEELDGIAEKALRASGDCVSAAFNPKKGEG